MWTPQPYFQLSWSCIGGLAGLSSGLILINWPDVSLGTRNRHVLTTQVHLNLQKAGQDKMLETRAWDDKGTLSTTGTPLPHFVLISQAIVLLTVVSDS